tara:strand:+ start:7806 stop:8840 length:1035 start_codon:yes stop_codon:yes gene_type:complete
MRLVKIPGRNNWYVRYSIPGSRRSEVESTGTKDEGQAKVYLKKFEIELNSPTGDVGCTMILDAYLNARQKAVAKDRIKYALIPLKEYFGIYPYKDVDEDSCRQYSEWRGKSSGTVRREIGVLKSALRMAKHTPSLWMPKKTAPRQDFLTRSQAKDLLDGAASHHIFMFILIALSTGARKTSILNLTWERSDLKTGILDFNEPGREITNKKRAISPIGKKLSAAMRDTQTTNFTKYVVEYKRKKCKDIKKGFAAAAKRAGLSWCQPHHCKHTAISWFAEDGYTVDEISDMTETDPETVRGIYRKFNPEYLRSLANSQEERLFDGPSENTDRIGRHGKRRNSNRPI